MIPIKVLLFLFPPIKAEVIGLHGVYQERFKIVPVEEATSPLGLKIFADQMVGVFWTRDPASSRFRVMRGSNG